MNTKTFYPGFIKLPGKEIAPCEVRVHFNGQVTSYPNQTLRERYSFRMLTQGGEPGAEPPELSFELTSEQWMELIVLMKVEYERSQSFRKDLEAR
jgi:hypothetical protein